MNFRGLWGFFGGHRAWIHLSRKRVLRCTNSFTRYGGSAAKYPRTAILISFTGVYNASAYSRHDLSECNVDDAYLQELAKELFELDRLKHATIICKKCNQRLLVDKPVDDKVYCKCDKNTAIVDEKTGWQPFLETKDIIIWRREEKPGNGLYEYKVYGRYEEVTAEDFLSMHTDLAYWKSWDDTALSIKKLKQLPHTPLTKNQEIIYWETLWPRFFANRDYVYVRRHAYMDFEQNDNSNNLNPHNINRDNQRLRQEVQGNSVETSSVTHNTHKDDDFGHKIDKHTKSDPENVRNAIEIGNFMKSQLFKERKKIIVLTSQSCEHPDAPSSNKAHRVKRYRSDLVIKPFTDLNKPGIEFSLTYFDDPGTSIPNALQSWVAGHACPDFLHKMRLAARDYKKSPQATSNKTENQPTVIEKTLKQQDSVLSESVEETKIKKKLLYKEKTERDTVEFLNLLNGASSMKDGVENVNEANTSNEQDEQVTLTNEKTSESTQTCTSRKGRAGDGKAGCLNDKQPEEVAEKHKDQQSINFWHIWPLYYFA